MHTLATSHPNAATLAAFAVGKLDPALVDGVAQHLENCTACQKVVEATPADSFVDKVARAQQPMAASGLEFTASFGGARAERAAAPAALPPELADHPRYKVLRELGKGGMGLVYLADEVKLERRVALKVVNQELLKHPQALARFEQEAKSAAKLPPHQNIVQTYTFEQLGNLHLLVLEYVDGVDLEKFVHTKGVPALHLACHLVRQAALGLQHAHEHKLIHRDIKPNNLMLTRKGQVKLLDFGLSKVVQAGEGERQGLTGQDAYMGTPDYMAPEQAMSARDADIRADLYSLGCTLYFLLTGRPPFPRETRVATYMAHQTEAPPPPSRFRPEVPPALDAIVLKLLAKLPQERFQKPVELAQALVPFAKKDASVYQAAGPVLPTAAPPADPACTAVGQDTAPNPVAAPPAAPPPAWSAVVRKRTSQPKFRQGLIVAAAAVVMLAALGIVLYIATDHGTITIELSDPTAKVELKVDGEVITLTGPTDPLRLKPGPHGLTITGKDFETTTHEFTVNRGTNPPLKISLKPKGGGMGNTFVPSQAAGDQPAPPSSPREPANPKTDYDAIATGTWIPVLRSADELQESKNILLEGGVLKAGPSGGRAVVTKFQATDMIIRAKVRKISGQNLNFKLRTTGLTDVGGSVYGWFNGGNHFGIGKWFQGQLADLGNLRARDAYNGFFELAFAAVGRKVSLYANGKLLLQSEDETPSPGYAVVDAYRGESHFRDVEIMILDRDVRKETKYFRIVNRNSKKAFDVDREGQVIQWEVTPDRVTQEWSLIPIGDFYKIKNRRSGKLLNVTGGTSRQGAILTVANDQMHGAEEAKSSELWRIIPKGEYVLIQARCSQLYASVHHDWHGNGFRLFQWPLLDDRKEQEWRLINTKED